jgi:hypothetical protein
MSEEMIARYREMIDAGSNNFQGLGILQYADEIGELLRKHDARTVLDYGSGRGAQYERPHKIHEGWGVPLPTLYDPAFETHDRLPKGKFDAVICSDVLEHIPQEELPKLVRRLFDYSSKIVWASVCCRAAKKTFPDGHNLHVTIEGFWWWQAKFAKWSQGKSYVLIETR